MQYEYLFIIPIIKTYVSSLIVRPKLDTLDMLVEEIGTTKVKHNSHREEYIKAKLITWFNSIVACHVAINASTDFDNF